MGTKIHSFYAEEVAAIRRIRSAHSKFGAYKLATMIRNGTVKDPAIPLMNRSRLSTLSVIRRYDADVKAGKTPVLQVA